MSAGPLEHAMKGIREAANDLTARLLDLAKLLPFTTFVTVASLYLLTAGATSSHNDVFHYAHIADEWVRTGSAPEAWTVKPGWILILTAIYSIHSAAGSDALLLIRDAQLVSIVFSGLAAAALYLIAKRLFDSIGFAIVATVVFAANPVIWFWGRSGMTDVPALSMSLLSFLFFLRHFQERKARDLVLSGLFAGAAGLLRLPSMIVIVPYFLGFLFIAFEETNDSLVKKLGRLSWFALLTLASAAILPLLFYGIPTQFVREGPQLLSTSLNDLLQTTKWYVARDIGWSWGLLAWIGLAAGVTTKKTRPIALVLTAGILAPILHIADWYEKTAEATGRYIMLTIPFSILGLGFLWRLGKGRIMPAAITLLMAVFAVLVASGLRAPNASRLADASFTEKLAAFPYLQASSFAGRSRDSLAVVVDHRALGRVLPDDMVLLLPVTDWSMTPFFFDVSGKHRRRIVRVEDDASTAWIGELRALPKGTPVYVPASLRREPITTMLADGGFAPAGRVFDDELYEKRP